MSASVDRIMQDLQQEVHKYVLVIGEPGTQPGKPTTIARVRRFQWVNSHLPIGWPVMSRHPIHQATALAQKITRRLLRWYINPIVDQQNQFNEAAADALAQHQRALSAAEAKIQELEQEVERAQRRIELLQNKVRALEEATHER